MTNMVAGLNIPDDFYSLIEIPENNAPVKYEMNKEYNALFVDRCSKYGNVVSCELWLYSTNLE